MAAVMQRLQSMAGLLPPDLSDEEGNWAFKKHLTVKDNAFFQQLIINHSVLTLEYNILCTQLTHEYFRNSNQAEITEQLVAALVMAELLDYIFRYYLNVPREVVRLQNEQQIYRQLLMKRGFHFDDINPYGKKADTKTQFIRTTAATINWYRLFLIRTKRVLNAIVPFAQNLESYCRFMASLDKYANPIISYLAWLFFIPRLVTCLTLLFKHLVPGPWMNDNVKELDFIVWLLGQLQRRWFEIFNDAAWMIGGLLNCFILVGPLAPVGVLLNLSLYIYDVVLASVRMAIEITRLKRLQAEYASIALKMVANNASPEELDEIRRFQQHLAERLFFEQKRLLLAVVNTSVLTVAFILCMPAALATLIVVPAAVATAISVLALVGACLLLASTIATYILTQLLESQRPQNKLNRLTASTEKSSSYAPQRLFQPAPSFEPASASSSLEEDEDLNGGMKFSMV